MLACGGPENEAGTLWKYYATLQRCALPYHCRGCHSKTPIYVDQSPLTNCTVISLPWEISLDSCNAACSLRKRWYK